MFLLLLNLDCLSARQNFEMLVRFSLFYGAKVVNYVEMAHI